MWERDPFPDGGAAQTLTHLEGLEEQSPLARNTGLHGRGGHLGERRVLLLRFQIVDAEREVVSGGNRSHSHANPYLHWRFTLTEDRPPVIDSRSAPSCCALPARGV